MIPLGPEPFWCEEASKALRRQSPGAISRLGIATGASSFRRLAEQFEYCVHGLNRVRGDLEALRHEQYQFWKENLLDG